MSRDAKPGELREITLFEWIEKMSKRPESRVDLFRYLEKLRGPAQIYVKHLVMSGPSNLKAAAKETGLSVEDVEAALLELETGLSKLRGKPINP